MHGMLRAVVLAAGAWLITCGTTRCVAEPPKFWTSIKSALGGNSTPPANEAATPVIPPSGLANGNASDSTVVWHTFARSVEGRPLEYTQCGQGTQHVLVIGSLLGTEPEGVAVANSLAEHLTRFPQRLDNMQVTIVRCPNPDGFAKRTAGNARGVLLDRNFLTVGWRKVADNQNLVSGREPESEPETKALADLFGDVRPERVIVLGTGEARDLPPGLAGTLRFTGPVDHLARQVSLEGGLKLLQNDSQQTSGSLATYSGTDRGIATLVFGFAPRTTADELFLAHKRALLMAVCGGTPIDPPSATTASMPTAPASVAQTIPRSSVYLHPIEPPPASFYGPPPTSTLRFVDMVQPPPMVPVAMPGGEPGTVPVEPTPSFVQPASSRAAQPAVEFETPQTQIRRLPAVENVQPRPNTLGPDWLPQSPIPTYPETGLP